MNSTSSARSYEHAYACHRRGQLSDAEQYYRATLAARPAHFGALHGLGIICLGQGRFDEAIRLLRKALSQNPRSHEALASLADALYALKRFDEAVKRYEKALELRPDFPEVENSLANALRMLGRNEAAVAHYGQALALRPDYIEARFNLGNALLVLNRLAEARARYEEILSVRPDHLEARYNLACILQREARFDEAATHYQWILARDPRHAGAHNNLGFTLQVANRHEEALEHFRHAIAAAPDLAEAHTNLGRSLTARSRPEEALAFHRRALELKPDFPEAETDLANALNAIGQTDEALEHYETALSLKPDCADAYASRGILLQQLGHLTEARADLEKAVALAPRIGMVHRILAVTKRFDQGDPQLKAIEDVLSAPGSLPIDDRAELHFAAAKAYDDLADYAHAFQHLLRANALKRERSGYDEPATLDLFDRVRAKFTREFIETRLGAAGSAQAPIFIVGMPRSGTTLVEQILASHPAVFAGGELTTFEGAIRRVCNAHGAADLSQALASLTTAQLAEIGRQYSESIARKAPGAAYVTDKMPHNFLVLGPIRLALPHARMIHVRRNPIDTCLSCFSQCFSDSVAYSYELGELGRYCRAYERLMGHWRAALPEGSMLEVDYEAIVADLEGQARRIIADCNLPWNEACLAFHQTKRRIQTASVVQVRQPLYQSSVGRWRHYQKELAPLFEALEIEPMGSAPAANGR